MHATCWYNYSILSKGRCVTIERTCLLVHCIPGFPISFPRTPGNNCHVLSFDLIHITLLCRYTPAAENRHRRRREIIQLLTKRCTRACLKNHFRNLQAPICGRFYPHSDKISHKLGLTAQEKPFSDTFRSSRFRIRRSTEESAESGSSCCHCFRSHSHHYFRSKPEGSRSRECSYSFRFRPRN